MKIRVGTILGAVLFLLGIAGLASKGGPGAFIPLLIGASLIFLGIKGGRTGIIVFGHVCIAVGAFMIAWGIYLIPVSQPTVAGILAKPLFWGIFSLMGGVCANYHGMCACIRNRRGLDKS